MKLYIKNMVCERCKMVVKKELQTAGLHPLTVDLGEIEIEIPPTKDQLGSLRVSLQQLGFEIIDDRKSQIIEKIKTSIVKLVHHPDVSLTMNLSDFIVSKVHRDYNSLSNLFSEVEGTTIEKYFISQRIEKVKELLVYNEMTLSEIAYQLGYSSVAYLSNQFKKVTGLTPTYYKSLKEHKRRNIEEL
jgi:AraC-like DNA-binding protein